MRRGSRTWDRSAASSLRSRWTTSGAAGSCIGSQLPGSSRLLRAARPAMRKGAMPGKVHIVGAGPGDPELLTLRGLRTLEAADVVLHDDLVSREILARTPSTAAIFNVGK